MPAERERARRYYQRAKARIVIAALRDLGLQGMDDLDTPTTYHLGRTLDLDTPPVSEGTGNAKPPGLWSAPGGPDPDGRIRTTWSDWSASNGTANIPTEQLWAITPKPGSVLLRIDTTDDLTALERAAPLFTSDTPRAGWEELKALGVTGVFLTEQGHHAAYRHYYGTTADTPGHAVANDLAIWDVGSAVWFDNTLVTATPVEKAVYSHADPPEDVDDDDSGWERWEVTAPPVPYDMGRVTVKEPRGSAMTTKLAHRLAA